MITEINFHNLYWGTWEERKSVKISIKENPALKRYSIKFDVEEFLHKEICATNENNYFIRMLLSAYVSESFNLGHWHWESFSEEPLWIQLYHSNHSKENKTLWITDLQIPALVKELLAVFKQYNVVL